MTKRNKSSDGGIKKGDLIRQTLATAPPMDMNDVENELNKFMNLCLNKYIWLNSRELNYNMVFKRGLATNVDTAKHIISYLLESSFCQPEIDYNESAETFVEAQIVPMTDIRAIQYDQKNKEIDLYIGLTHFKLTGNDWIIEDVVIDSNK